jgi:DNA-binding transcriptional regulator YhcF (GntR family)
VGFVAFGGMRTTEVYLQSNEWFLGQHPRSDAVRIYHYLCARFQNKCIYAGLDERTCARAGVSKRTLQRWLRMLFRLQLCGRHKVMGHYVFMGMKVMEGRFPHFSPNPTKAQKHQCRLRLTNQCTMAEVRQEIARALAEQELRQTAFAVAKLNEDKPLTVDQAFSGRQIHHQVLACTRSLMESRRGLGHTAVSVSAFAAAMRVSRSTASKRLRQMEKAGDMSILRRKRLVPDSYKEAHAEPREFQRTWGARYFRGRGGWCWINATSLFKATRDHRKPRVNAE